MKKKACLMLALSVLLLTGVVGCSANKKEEVPEISTEDKEAVEDDSESSEVEDVTSVATEATIYISTDYGNTYEETQVQLETEMTPEILIEQIAEITCWNLELADQVTTGSGGMTVAFAKTSSLYVGPPEEQNETYYIFDDTQMCSAILDSVKYTLQHNFVDEELGGNPESLDIYYCGENDTELFFEETGGMVPMTEPYSEILYGQGDITAILYSPDDELLEMQKIECYEKITDEQDLYDTWEKSAKLDGGTQVLGFDGKTLDLSGEFAVFINNFGSSGEIMYIEGLTTTFKEYYKLNEIYLTIEGEVLETGHNIYDYAL